MHIDSLDHLVLTVANIDATVAFYTQALGMGIVTFGVGRKALTFGSQRMQPASAGERTRTQGRTANAWFGRSVFSYYRAAEHRDGTAERLRGARDRRAGEAYRRTGGDFVGLYS